MARLNHRRTRTPEAMSLNHRSVNLTLQFQEVSGPAQHATRRRGPTQQRSYIYRSAPTYPSEAVHGEAQSVRFPHYKSDFDSLLKASK